MSRSSDRPTSDEIRAALARILDSRAFRASPQLTAFLRFVVQAELAGMPDRIKGYTIAVEALGRGDDFDPQTDPIVRVEAARLRRALERYYSEAGAAETVVIDLPRGSYVPKFRRAGDPPEGSGQPVRSILRARSRPRDWRDGLMGLVGAAGLTVGGYALLDAYFHPNFLNHTATVPRPAAHARHAGPTIDVAPIRAIGPADATATTAASLQERLYDALVRFDSVRVIMEAGPRDGARAPAADYRLASTFDYRDDGSATLIARLSDARENVVFWSRSFEIARQPDDAALDTVVETVAGTLVEPYGAIHARELGKHATDGDSVFSCVLKAYEYLWARDKALESRMPACLEQAVAADPTFSRGFSLLAAIYLNKYRFDAAADRAAMLERALTAARTGVRLNTNSVRAHAVLADVLAASALFADAKEAAERAVALNPLDPIASMYHAAVLVAAGEANRADAPLREVFAALPDPPQRTYFIAFVADYLRDDMQGAREHAARQTRFAYAPALLARALAAWKAGDREGARRAIEALDGADPAWASEPRDPIRRIFPLPEMAARFAADFAAARGFAGL